MIISLLESAIFPLVAVSVTGWVLFSAVSGMVIYLSTLTRDNSELDCKKQTKNARGARRDMHLKDPKVLEPLEAAKKRWCERRNQDLIKKRTVVSRDGLRLAGYYWAAGRTISGSASGTAASGRTAGGAEEAGCAGAPKTVVLVHAMNDSAASLGYLAEAYHSVGWNVLSIDMRAHGESEGSRCTMGVREAEDISLWVDDLVRSGYASRIYLHGESMGAAAVLLYAGRGKKTPPEVKGVIADSSYARYGDVFSRSLGQIFRSRLAVLSIRAGASLASFLCSGVSFSQMSPALAVVKTEVPLLFFHGERDSLVPLTQVHGMLHEAVRRGAISVIVPEASHAGAYFYAPDLYMQKIGEFDRRSI